MFKCLKACVQTLPIKSGVDFILATLIPIITILIDIHSYAVSSQKEQFKVKRRKLKNYIA